MAECSDCGRNMPEGASYCPGCGASLERTQSQTPPPISQAPLPQLPGRKRTKRGFPTGAVIAIIAGCITFIIIVVMVVLLSISVVDIFKEPVDVANAYVKALSAGDLQTAWDYLSVRTRVEKGRAGFAEDVRGLEGQIKKWNTHGIQIKDRRSQITMDVEFKNGKETTIYIYLVKEAGKWRVSSEDETPFPGFK